MLTTTTTTSNLINASRDKKPADDYSMKKVELGRVSNDNTHPHPHTNRDLHTTTSLWSSMEQWIYHDRTWMHMHGGQDREGDKGNQSHYSIKEHHSSTQSCTHWIRRRGGGRGWSKMKNIKHSNECLCVCATHWWRLICPLFFKCSGHHNIQFGGQGLSLHLWISEIKMSNTAKKKKKKNNSAFHKQRFLKVAIQSAEKRF